MKYSVEIEIDLPIDKVIEIFDNPDKIKHWMKGLQSFEMISGEPGEVGSKARLRYQMGKREIEMIETVTVRNLPKEFAGTYEANGVFNLVSNQFVALSENKTKLINEQEFQFKGFMKVIGFLFPGAFKKQSLQYLKDFKSYSEKAG